MTHTTFFQYNLPADNHRNGKTDHYINVIAEWMGGTYTDRRPIVFIKILTENIDLLVVKDFAKAYHEIEAIGEKQFTELARQQKIDDAKAVLALHDNPVLDRMDSAKEIGTIVINENGVATAY